VSAFVQSLAPTPLKQTYAPDGLAEVRGVDRALAVLGWLKTRSELSPALPRSLAQWLGPSAEASDTLLDLGDLAELDLLLSLLIPGWRLRDGLAELRARLAERGVEPKPVTTVRDGAAAKASRILIASGAAPAVTEGPELVPVAQLLGAPGPGNGFRCRLEAAERLRLMAELKATAPAPRCGGLHELAQAKLLLRRGAWREAVFAEPQVSFLATKEAKA